MRKTVVTTKFYGPTNTLGSRVKVSAWAGSKFVPFRHDVGSWNGISESGIGQIVADLLGEVTGWSYDIKSVERTSGPDDDLVYWLVTYDESTEWDRRG